MGVQRAGRGILIQVVVLVVLVAAVALGLTFWYQGQNYVSTDDAQVTAPTAPVGALVAGTLTTWTAQVGDTVSSGQVLGAVTPAGAPGAATPAMDIVAPFAGTVLDVDAVAGQTVTPGAPLAYIGNLAQISVTAYVKESVIRNVATGQRVDVTVDALPGTTFSGTVQQLGLATAATFSLLPSATQSGDFTKVAQVIPVEVSLGGPAEQLVPGESAEVRIHIH